MKNRLISFCGYLIQPNKHIDTVVATISDEG